MRRIQTLCEFRTSPEKGWVRTSFASSMRSRTALWCFSRSRSTAAAADGSRPVTSCAAIAARLSTDAERVSSIANRPKLTRTMVLAMIAM